MASAYTVHDLAKSWICACGNMMDQIFGSAPMQEVNKVIKVYFVVVILIGVVCWWGNTEEEGNKIKNITTAVLYKYVLCRRHFFVLTTNVIIATGI